MHLLPIIHILRPKHWVKNTFIWIAGFFAGNLFSYSIWQANLVAFVVFCALSSAVYIFNDYLDKEKDALHPIKRERPLAKGTLKVTSALFLGIVCLIIAGIGLFSLNHQRIWIIAAVYLGINLIYSSYLKNIPIIDLHIIALGFMLRVFMGGYASGVPVSHWLILLTYLLALVLGLAKRRGELQHLQGTETRSALNGYNLPFIDLSMTILLSVIVVCYLMYSLSPMVIAHFRTPHFYLTVILVILGLLRYLQLTLVYKQTESPTNVLFKDVFIQIVILAWLSVIGFLLYG